ncbi:uncharacterized protein BXIN_1870 [Babesia sp. Xinjiang]|uniref:uncharacterized protein n=1 Tax=Babesia sp. Xinjiang TaxID=462227 RepID=UPI000A25D795|nr:uncharacterized protein BXIN_1870 [Babesia sp. Xinjiang]ORM40367.1 hypothetical protein BXIN_1870 [Babesia sp. Xinjiang]
MQFTSPLTIYLSLFPQNISNQSPAEMGQRYRKLNAALCVLIYTATILSIQTARINLTATEFPPCVDVFEGIFSGGGVYRMFHSHSSPISIVEYGIVTLLDVSSKKCYESDTYVQDYRRGDHVFVTISRFHGKEFKVLHTFVYEIKGNELRLSSHELKKAFVGGLISLKLDLAAPKQHPFIAVAPSYEDVQHVMWSIIPLSRGYQKLSPARRIRNRHDRYMISPMVNLDKEYNDENDPPSSISCYNSNIHISTKQHTVLVIKHPHLKYHYRARIPQVEDNIFKPRNVLSFIYDFTLPAKGAESHRNVHINIDISTTETTESDIFILANLRRGCWLYSQYSIIPLMDQSTVSVKVMNSDKYLIYEGLPNFIITHVEVFNHVTKGWQYVVVNTIKVEPSKVASIQKVFFRHDEDGNTIYFDLDMFWAEPYIDMLYNINVLEKCADKEENDILQEALVKSDII